MKRYLILLLLLFSFSYANVNIYSNNAILIDGRTGKILYEKAANEKAYPASTTKILTALIALNQHLDFSELIIPSHDAIFSIPSGSSIAYFSEDEELNFEQVMYGLMLPSGNDAANIIAERVSGSTEEFAKLMNSTAKKLGAKNSNFVNANGLHDDNHYSTAYDLALIAKEAMLNKNFRKIVSTYHYSMPKTNRTETEREFYNTNKLLNPNSEFYYKDAIGIKTGFTSNAKNCLVAAAERDGIYLISVVLGGSLSYENGSEVYNDTTNLLNYGFSLYTPKTILAENSTVDEVLLKYAKKKTKVNVINEKPIIAQLEKNTNPTLEQAISYNDNFKLPLKKGTQIGTVSYYLDDTCVATSDLIAANDVEKTNIIIYYIGILSKLIIYAFLSLIILCIVLRIFNELRKAIKRRRKAK